MRRSRSWIRISVLGWIKIEARGGDCSAKEEIQDRGMDRGARGDHRELSYGNGGSGCGDRGPSCGNEGSECGDSFCPVLSTSCTFFIINQLRASYIVAKRVRMHGRCCLVICHVVSWVSVYIVSCQWDFDALWCVLGILTQWLCIDAVCHFSNHFINTCHLHLRCHQAYVCICSVYTCIHPVTRDERLLLPVILPVTLSYVCLHRLGISAVTPKVSVLNRLSNDTLLAVRSSISRTCPLLPGEEPYYRQTRAGHLDA